MFKVGDKVWAINNGWGVVRRIDECQQYPVVVKFVKRDLAITYTLEGIEALGERRTLFFEEIPIPESALISPRWRAERGESYYSVNCFGEVIPIVDLRWETDGKMWLVGNYFETEEEAKESKIYKAFHEEV